MIFDSMIQIFGERAGGSDQVPRNGESEAPHAMTRGGVPHASDTPQSGVEFDIMAIQPPTWCTDTALVTSSHVPVRQLLRPFSGGASKVAATKAPIS